MAKIETRYAEVRAEGEGRILIGQVMAYRDVAILPFGKETFLPGSFSPVENLDVILNYAHIRGQPIARTGGGGLVLEDSETVLSLRAEIPKTSIGDDVLALVRSSVLRGLSVEFSSIAEKMISGVRVIHKAALHAIGVVDSGAYRMSVVEARADNYDQWLAKLKREILWL